MQLSGAGYRPAGRNRTPTRYSFRPSGRSYRLSDFESWPDEDSSLDSLFIPLGGKVIYVLALISPAFSLYCCAYITKLWCRSPVMSW